MGGGGKEQENGSFGVEGQSQKRAGGSWGRLRCWGEFRPGALRSAQPRGPGRRQKTCPWGLASQPGAGSSGGPLPATHKGPRRWAFSSPRALGSAEALRLTRVSCSPGAWECARDGTTGALRSSMGWNVQRRRERVCRVACDAARLCHPFLLAEGWGRGLSVCRAH